MYKNKKSCLIYVRKANSENDVGYSSLSQQEQRCRKYARENNIVVRKVIKDIGSSGNCVARKGLFDLFNCLETQYEIEYLLVTNPTRLGRKSYLIIREIIKFIGQKIKVVSVDLGNEESNPHLEFNGLLKELIK
jgi:DNA invertase Pin-like site-specific DNA recombinase